MRRFRLAASGFTTREESPIAELNITPLIDVMLVLLVMFILVLPTVTHKLPVDLPQPAPDVARPTTTHRLTLGAGGNAVLDGRGLDDVALGQALAAVRQDRQAVLVMRTDPAARYERFDQVLAVVKRSGINRLGFEGNAELAR